MASLHPTLGARRLASWAQTPLRAVVFFTPFCSCPLRYLLFYFASGLRALREPKACTTRHNYD